MSRATSPVMNTEAGPFRPAVYGIVGLLVSAVVIGLAMNVSRLPIIGEGGREVSANFSDAGGLEVGDRVEVAGVRVGAVREMAIEGDHIHVSFTVPDDMRLGDRTRARIKVSNLLGSKFINVEPGGPRALESTIPVDRTTSPYDVTTAFADLTETVEPIDTANLTQALDVVSSTFEGSGPDVRASLRGLTDLSKTISTRDAAITRLLSHSNELAASLDGSRDDIAALVREAASLLAELDRRRDALDGLLVHTRQLSEQLRGLVADNKKSIGPALTSLGVVTAQLERRQDSLRATIRAVAKFARLFVNTVGGGPWFDSYIANAPDSLKLESP